MSALANVRLASQPVHNEENVQVGTVLGPQIAILDTWPGQATYGPGEAAAIYVSLVNRGNHAMRVRIAAELRWLDERLLTTDQDVDLAVGSATAALPLALPDTGFRGYGIDVSVLDATGALLASDTTALDVLLDWTEAPRYGFLSDFSPGDPLAATNVQALARYHINVVQFYDWMWRHYVLMPPTAEYTDGMGRLLSIHTVRAKVSACEAAGMAAMSYAAVYGAEPEYALKHPDEMLYDGSGKPYSIENLFYVMNIHKGNSWRRQILAEMARAVRDVPFDGLHLDQYGFRKSDA